MLPGRLSTDSHILKYPELPQNAVHTDSWQKGVSLLRNPAWPLCNMAIMLYLTGPYSRFAQLLEDMPDELEIASITYREPAKILTDYLPFLNIFERFKTDDHNPEDSEQPPDKSSENNKTQTEDITVLSESGDEADAFEAATARAKQNIVDRELETINSLLCAPCRCTLCCTGPDMEAGQEFFEIPLHDSEKELFDLPVIDSEKSRKTSPYAEIPLKVKERPFYLNPPGLYRWSHGWSMILTRGSSCPALSSQGTCAIYPTRPKVCRKPQIFAVILKRRKEKTYTMQNTVLAVWDCPYVRCLKDDITGYAAMNETDVVFRENKS